MTKRIEVKCITYDWCAEKLLALTKFQGLASIEEVAGICLDQGILAMWETYRNNPKHMHQIREWEAKNKDDS